MAERTEITDYPPITHLFAQHDDPTRLQAFNQLQRARAFQDVTSLFEGFSPKRTYAEYMDMPKTFVDKDQGQTLVDIALDLKDEWLPDYLNAGGWAAAEAALVSKHMGSVERMELLDLAESSWQTALSNQGDLNRTEDMPWLIETNKEFRLALNLAFTPLMKSIIAGDVTQKIREKTFADTLAIAELSAVQFRLSQKAQDAESASGFSGLSHECNALLAFLYINDPNFLPIPSTYRAGSGYEHRTQTHDITIINQHWGNIWNVYPVEIKARPNMKDKKRYHALIIKGRSHLSLPGSKLPLETTAALAAMYSGYATDREVKIVNHTTTTVKELLSLYRKGEIPDEFKEVTSQTRFHDKDYVVQKYPELKAS